MAKEKDPTEPIRLKASGYPGVDEGTACTQSSFKAGKKSFLFVGMQGGRYKAMFKLEKSMPEARALAKSDPDLYQAPKGPSGWVTARFTAEKPMPKRLWQKWLGESYGLSTTDSPKKKTAKKKTTKKKTTKKKTAKKKTTRKKTTKKKTTKKKTTKKKTTKKKTTKKKTTKKKTTKKRSNSSRR